MITARDIPKENIFIIGAMARSLDNDEYVINGYHFLNPRKPFLVSRAEALNIIGYMISHGMLTPANIDAAVKDLENQFQVSVNGAHALIVGPRAVFKITPPEGLRLIGALIRELSLRPAEIDAAVVAIGEHAQGQSLADIPVIRH